jgi:hypothetical protein
MRITWPHGVPLVFLVMCGCGVAPSPKDSGARAAAQTFYEALLSQDWPRAYDALHPDNRARYNLAQFTNLARTYRQSLGFEPIAVHIRSCDEHGAEATVHVVLTGRSGARARQYKDALILRTSAVGWGAILPPRFGQTRR